MSDARTILIVDDDDDHRSTLERDLKAEGYRVVTASRGDKAIDAALGERPDLVLLDLMLPRLSGEEVCVTLRQRAFDSPIIILTAKTDETDRVIGLGLGADVYLTKPFSRKVLLAQVRACLRRAQQRPADGMSRYRFDGIEVNFEARTASKGGSPLDLTPREIDLLRYLIRRRGEVCTREDILDEIWSYDTGATTRTIDTHVANLRKKLEPHAAAPRHILTVYGEGYQFVD